MIQGDSRFDISKEEVTDIWEERTPIEGFKFDVEPIVYIKKIGVMVGGGVKQGHQVSIF